MKHKLVDIPLIKSNGTNWREVWKVIADLPKGKALDVDLGGKTPNMVRSNLTTSVRRFMPSHVRLRTLVIDDRLLAWTEPKP